jgi:hypothetical protein
VAAGIAAVATWLRVVVESVDGVIVDFADGAASAICEVATSIDDAIDVWVIVGRDVAVDSTGIDDAFDDSVIVGRNVAASVIGDLTATVVVRETIGGVGGVDSTMGGGVGGVASTIGATPGNRTGVVGFFPLPSTSMRRAGFATTTGCAGTQASRSSVHPASVSSSDFGVGVGASAGICTVRVRRFSGASTGIAIRALCCVAAARRTTASLSGGSAGMRAVAILAPRGIGAVGTPSLGAAATGAATGAGATGHSSAAIGTVRVRITCVGTGAISGSRGPKIFFT